MKRIKLVLGILLLAAGLSFAADNRPIGVFDSGTGGLTVLEKMLTDDFAHEKFVYLGDQANMPYGDYAAAGKSDFLRGLVIRDAEFLLEKNAKIIVIACNTATAYGYDAVAQLLAKRGDGTRVIGVVNAGARSAIRQLDLVKNPQPCAIGVMATPGTIASGVYERTIRAELMKLGVTCEVQVFSRGCAGLADAVEAGSKNAPTIACDNLRALMAEHRAKAPRLPLKAVILGCTHFPFVQHELESLAPKGVIFVDPAVDTAAECADMLQEQDRRTDAQTPMAVETFVSVAAPGIDPSKLDEKGGLTRAWKYGRTDAAADRSTVPVPIVKATNGDPLRFIPFAHMIPRVKNFLTIAEDVSAPTAEGLEPFPCSTPRVTVWTFMDQTDGHDELVHKDEWLYGYNEISNEVRAALVAIEDPLTGRGTAYLRLAPLPHARANPEAADFTFFGRPLPPDFVQRGFRIHDTGYPCVKIPYAGGVVGRTKALQDYQRTVRPYVSGRDGLFLSNTWGDRNRDTRIQEEFLLDEIKAAANLGVEVVQVDDGWQSGKSANSAYANGKGVWNGYWAASSDFWVPDPKRFPHGLGFMTKVAAEQGINFGLWFGPDSSNDAANWERDADWLLKLHRECGVNYYKLDSMKTTGEVSLQRQQRLFDKVLKESQGKIVIDLDVTAERRPGYFGMMKSGPLFVENRYSDYKTYWPHLTLRTLWSLIETIDPIRLRMEVLNPLRNREKYLGSPLAPAAYPAETLFAIVMPASPLGWFEIQNLSPETVAAWKPLVATWKRERDAMAACNVIPVGAKPDGASWTGFVFVPRESGRSGYALFFRELSTESRYAFDFLKYFPIKCTGEGEASCCVMPKITVISPRGKADMTGVTVSDKLDFVWVKFTM